MVFHFRNRLACSSCLTATVATLTAGVAAAGEARDPWKNLRAEGDPLKTPEAARVGKSSKAAKLETRDATYAVDQQGLNDNLDVLLDRSYGAQTAPEREFTPGIDGLAGDKKWRPHIEFTVAPGNERSLGQINLFAPLMQDGDSLLFTDLRASAWNDDVQEGNFGVGYRQLVPGAFFGNDAILGVYGFFDARRSAFENMFYQGTLGAELITERFEFRVNGYLPSGTQYVVGTTGSGVALDGFNVVNVANDLVERALPGFDVEAGIKIDFSEAAVRLNAGYFRFERGDTLVEGPRFRAEVEIEDPFGWDGAKLSLGGEVRDDDVRGTEVSGLMRLRVPIGGASDADRANDRLSDLERLMTRRVYRDDDIVTPVVRGENTQTVSQVTDAASGETLQAFFVANTAQGAADCSSVANACEFVTAQGLAGAGDTFLPVDVAGNIGSVFTLNADRQQVIGAGATGSASIRLSDAAGSVLVVTSLGGRPIVTGVNMGHFADTRVAGLATNSATGIFGDGMTGTIGIQDVITTDGGLRFANSGATISVTDAAITSNAAIGIELTNYTGPGATFANTDVTATTGTGLRLNGGSGGITLDADSSITKSGAGAAVEVVNAHTGRLRVDGSVTATGGTGLQFNNADGTYNFNGASNLNGGDAGIDILNGSAGTFTFGANTSIMSPTGMAFNVDASAANVVYQGTIIQNNAANAVSATNNSGGTVTFSGAVTANTSTAAGVNLVNNAGATVSFTGGLDIDTTTGTGFSATGGGTVNVSNGAVVNSVNSTAGQAIDIDGVGGSLTFSTIVSTGAPVDGVAIDNFGAGATFLVTGATTVTTPGQDGVDIDNVAGTVTFSGPVTITTPTDDGVDLDDVTGMVTFAGPVTVTNPGDDGIDIEDSFNATLAFNGPVAITGAGGNGIELNGPGGVAPTAGTLTFGGSTTITNPNLAGVLGADRIGAVTFADLDIALQTAASAGLVLAGATINGNFTATDFDVTSTTNAGTAGVVLSGTMGPGTIQLGDSNVAGANASIAGVDAGVVFNAASNATFIFGDGEGVADKGSAISATTAIQGGSTVTMGSYDFDDVNFTGILDFTAGGAAGLVFVAATATGDGSGSDVNNRANVITADAITTVNTTFVLINDGAAIDDVDGFTLHNNQTMASFGNGRTFASGGLIIPANFSGIPGAGAVINDPTGNGAATLTRTGGAGDTLTASGTVNLQDFIVSNAAAGDGLAATGATTITSTGLTVQNVAAQGIDLDNLTGTATFNNTKVATGAGNAVDIVNSTVSFTGGLDIDTTSGIGLNATGGATISVAASAGDESITSTAGQALNLDTVTVGAGGINFDTVSSTNAGNGNAGIRLNALTGAGGVTITNARVVDSGGLAGGNGIELTSIGTAGALTIANIDIDMPITGGNNLRGISSFGGHTSDINLGTGAGGVTIDDTALGIQLNGTAGTINIGTGAGSGGLQLNTLGQGINIGNNATGTINIGNTATTSVIDAGNAVAGQSGILLNQADATVTMTGIDINGSGTGAASHGIHLFDNDALGSFTLNGTNTIDNTGGDGIRIEGTNAMISGVTIGASATGVGDDITGNGVNVLDNGQTISVSIDTVTVADARGAGIKVDGSGAGSVTINSFNNNTVTDADVRGVDILDATFDAVTGGAIQQVTGGNLSVGTIGDRVEGDGVRLDQVLGDISFGTVDIFNNNGTGLFIRDAAGKGGVFAFGNTGGTINTTTGAAVDIDPVTMSSTFANLTSTASAGRGVNLDTIAGTFTVTGTTSVNGSTTEGVRVVNSTAAINLGTLNVSGTTGDAVLIENNGGGSFTVTGGTVTKAGVTGDALDINGGAMAVNFGANLSHTSIGGDAVSIRGGTTGNITVSGTIANTTGGRAIDINNVAGGTVSFTGATVTDTIGMQIASVAAGANVNFSAGTTVTLNAPGLIGINLSNNAGTIAFNGAVDINNARASGIVLVNANANVTFGQLDIELGAGAANADAISIAGTPGTLTFGVTTITNVGGAANQKGIDLGGATLGGTVSFQSVAISGPDTSTNSIGVDLRGVLGNQIVNLGNQAAPATGPSSSITDLHRGVVINNTAAVQFTFGDGESPNDTGSSINVNGQAGAFTVDVGGGTLAASSFDFNDVAFGAGDTANLPGAAAAAVFVSQTGGAIVAGTHGLSQTLNTITVAAAEALADTDQTFVFVAHTGAGTIDLTGGGADGFTLKAGQSLNGFDDGTSIAFGTTQPVNVEGNLGATGGNVTQNSVTASNSNAGATAIITTAAGGGGSTIQNTVFDASGLGAGDAVIRVDGTGAASPVTINNVEIANVGAGAAAVVLNNNASTVALTDVDLVGANAGTALGIDAGAASTAAITVNAASDIDGTTGTVVAIGGGARNVTVSTNIAAANNTANVVDIDGQTGGTIGFGTVTSSGATGDSVIETTGQTGGTLTFGNVAITTFGNASADTAIDLAGTGGTATFADVDIATTNGGGFSATGAGMTVGVTSGDLNVTGGAAVNLVGVRANAFSLTSVTADGNGANDGINLNSLGANSSFTVTGATNLNDYANNGIEISNLSAATQVIAFGAVNINTTAGQVQATGDGIAINTVSSTGVNIDFGAVTVGNATNQSDTGVSIGAVTNAATGFDLDFASLALTNLDEAFLVDNFDAPGASTITVTGTTSIADARTNGIEITNSDGDVAFAGTTTILNDAAGANASGIDLGASAGGANTGAYSFNGLNVTVNGAGAFGLRATSSGTLNVTGGTNDIISNNGTAVFINPTVTNITLRNVTSTNATGSGIDLTLSGASIFTVTGTTAVTGSDAAGVEITNSGGSTVGFNVLNIDNDGAAADGAGLVVNQGGTGTLNLNVTSGTIASGNDAAIDIRNTSTGTVNLGAAFTSVSVNSAAKGVNIENSGAGAMTGTLNTGTGGSITGTTDRGVDVEGGAAALTVGQSITNTAGRAVEVRGLTGGSFTHSGNISSTGATLTAISIQSNTGGTITLSGATKTIDTSAGVQNAVQVTNNTGATINFTNGGLDIDTNNGAGLTVTGGGTVTVQGTGNSVTTATGTGVNIANTTIGGAGVTFQSVTSNGAVNGIVLNTTGAGGFTVTGDASTIRNASGGTIQNTTGDAVRLTNVSNVTLENMNIVSGGANGVFGTAVNGFAIRHSIVRDNGNAVDEGQLRFADTNPGAPTSNGGTGTFVFDNILAEETVAGNNAEHLVEFINISGTMNLTVSGSTFQGTTNSPIGADGFLIETRGTANSTVSVTGSTFQNNATQGFQGSAIDNSALTVNIGTSTIRNNNEGIVLSAANNASLTFDINNNTEISGHTGTSIFVGTTSTATALSSVTGHIRNNGNIVNNSAVNHGIIVFPSGDSVATVNIENNTITGSTTFRMINVTNTDNFGDFTDLAIRIVNNSVTNSDAANNFNDTVYVEGDQDATVCAVISGNTVSTANGRDHIRLRERDAPNTTVRLEQGSASIAATADAALETNNPATTPGTQIDGEAGVAVVSNGTCRVAP